MASNFYRQQDGPLYILGHTLELGFVRAGLIGLILQGLNYRRINRKRDKQMAEGVHNWYTPDDMSVR